MKSTAKKSNWSWIPTLYFAEGIPYTVVMLIAVVFYKRMGISNVDITLYTSWLYLPWVIKPFWSPLVDMIRTKRFWIITMQLVIGAALGGVVLSIPLPNFFKVSLGFMWLLAFSSATHDIAADGFYMLGLSKHDQAWFVGVRSTFYRMAIIFGQGLLIMFAGYIESNTGLPNQDIQVYVVQGETTSNGLDYFYLEPNPAIEENKIICTPTEIKMNTQPISESRVDSVKTIVDYWNHHRGKISTTELDSLVLFAKTASNNVGEQAGNIAVAYISLSQPPEDDKVMMSFGLDSGDKSIKLANETQLTFTKENWNIPHIALFQLDPNLKSVSKAVFQARSGDIPLAWSLSFLVIGVLFLLFFIYHFFVLPKPASDKGIVIENVGNFFKNYFEVFAQFFTKEKIVLTIAFILIYRFGEAQLVKIAPLFMIDSIEAGGLALTTQQYGFIYGTLGAIALTLGGLLGGFVVAKQGLKYWILWMALAMKLPDVVYVYLSYVQPDNFVFIATSVAIEQFGYGFGFTAYMLYMITVSEGKLKTAHYAICTGFMALGMMIPGMFSGWLQELIGYQNFFIWVLICTIPGLLMIKFLPIDPAFGKKRGNSK